MQAMGDERVFCAGDAFSVKKTTLSQKSWYTRSTNDFQGSKEGVYKRVLVKKGGQQHFQGENRLAGLWLAFTAGQFSP